MSIRNTCSAAFRNIAPPNRGWLWAEGWSYISPLQRTALLTLEFTYCRKHIWTAGLIWDHGHDCSARSLSVHCSWRSLGLVAGAGFSVGILAEFENGDF